MYKKIIILLVIVCISCNKNSKTEANFITEKNEYWEYTDYCLSSGVYFQFHKDGTHDKYLLYINKIDFTLFNDDRGLSSGPRTWSIKNDSTFVWDKGVYKIEKMSKNEILLSYYHYEIKDKKCYVRLSKWVKTAKGPKMMSPDSKSVK